MSDQPVARAREMKALRSLLRQFPVVAVLGARQVGKTTLARELLATRKGHRFDLEDPRDAARLADPMRALDSLRGLVVLDEVQRTPDIFAVLRVLADRPKPSARFLVLGSASPDLLRQSSESLAGRISHHYLRGFSLDEVGPENWQTLWLRGGYPRAFLASNENAAARWRRELIATFLERDLPLLGVGVASTTLRRFWTMVAHYHAQTWNAAELARALAVSGASIARYLDSLEAAFAVRVLRPWHENLKKRQVKSPKVYVADTGLLHSLLGIETRVDLERHPKVGASFEGFAIHEVIRRLGAWPEECFFWATHAGAELDLLVVRGQRRYGFEIKAASAPRVTPSMRTAIADLGLTRLDVIHRGEQTFAMAPRIRAVPISRVHKDIRPLR